MMTRTIHRIWLSAFGALLFGIMAAAPGRVASGSPVRIREGQAVPLWPSTTVAALPLRGVESPEFLTAQLDGHGGQELVGIELLAQQPEEAGAVLRRQVTLYTWRGEGLERLGRARLELGWTQPAVGDLDGDGRDEIYAVDARTNRILTLRWTNGNLRVTHSALLTDRYIESLAVSDIRRAGAFELLIAVDSTRRFAPDEPSSSADTLLGYAWRRTAWGRTWRQRAEVIGLLAGDYHPRAGNELVFVQSNQDETPTDYEFWQWQGDRLVKRAAFVPSARAATASQHWIGVLKGLTSAPRTIVSQTTYHLPAGEPMERGELLVWESGTPRVAYRLPGVPVAAGEIRAPGRPAVLVRRGLHDFVLLERSAGQRQGTGR